MLPAWHVHIDVWLVIGAIGFAYWYLNARVRSRLRPLAPLTSPGEKAAVYTGLVLLGHVSSLRERR